MTLLSTLRIAVVGVVGTCGALACYKWCAQTNNLPPFLAKRASPTTEAQEKFIIFRKTRLLPLLATSLTSLGLTYLSFKSYIPKLLPTASFGFLAAISGVTLLLTPSHSFKDGLWRTPLGEESLTPLQANLTLGMYAISLGSFLRSAGVKFNRLLPFSVAYLGVFVGHFSTACVSTATVPYVLQSLAVSTVVGNWLLGEVFEGTRRGVWERDSTLVSVLSLGFAAQVLAVQSDKWKRGEKGAPHSLVVQDSFYLHCLVLLSYYFYSDF